MADLCWTPVVLVILLSAQCSFAAVDQTWLTNIVEGLKNEYALGDAFSLAVSIPLNQDPAGLKDVLQSDTVDKVNEAVSQGQVYQGTRVIAATQSDGLSRVLENLQTLTSNNQGNVLVIYSEVSPSSNDNSIADKIDPIIQNWSAYAFVFSRVIDVPDADTSQLAGSFKLLDISKLGLDNIFRCYKPDDSFQCTSCSSGGDVTPSCVANSAPSNQEQVTGAGADTGSDTGSGVDTGTGIDTGAGAGVDSGPGPGAGVDTGAGVDSGPGPGAGVDTGASTGAGTVVRKRRNKRKKAGSMRRSKKQRSRRNGKKQVKLRGGRRAGKRRGGGKRRKSGKRRGGGKRRKSGKRRGGGKRRKSGKRRGGGKRRKSGKRRGGGKRRKSGKRRGGGKRKRSGKRRGIFWEW